MNQREKQQPREITILAVDDETTIGRLYQSCISEMGYQIVVAQTAAQALEEIQKKYFDLVILDLMLPDLHGKELLKEIKERQGQALIIIVTGHPTLESSIEAIRAGVVYDYIIKPFKAEDFKLVIRRAVDKALLTTENKRLCLRLEIANRALIERVDQLERIATVTVDYERTINELKARIKQLEQL